MPKNEIYSYLKMADCFVMSSISEGFSIAKLEAMMFEKPLVLTQVGGAEDVIKNNDIGYLIPPVYDLSNNVDIKITEIKAEIDKGIYKKNNIDDFIFAIEDIIKNNEKWKDKAKLANLKVKNDYNVQAVMSKYLQLFDTMLQK